MKFEEFKEIIDMMVKHNKQVNNASSINIDLYDFCDKQDTIIYLLWGHILKEEAVKTLSWFLYEKGYIQDGKGRKDITAKDKDGTPICETLKNLYNYINDNEYFK